MLTNFAVAKYCLPGSLIRSNELTKQMFQWPTNALSTPRLLEYVFLDRLKKLARHGTRYHCGEVCRFCKRASMVSKLDFACPMATLA